VRLDHSEVTGSRWHAGVYVSAADGFSVDHDYVHDNGDPKRKESEYEDQGIYVNETTTGTVYDNLVTANVSYGVQLYRKADQVTVNHNTIVGNAYGGVVVSTECKGNLIANNIVVDNGGYGIRGTSIASEAGNEVVDNLVWGQEPHNTEGSIGITFSGTLETAPLFVGESDFHLQAGSPAIEAAGSPTVADDIENNARGNPSDLGAYEYVPPPAVEPAFVGATSASADASTTLTIAKPSGTAAGEVMVAQVVSRGGAAIVPPKGWSEIRDTAKSSSDHMTTFVKVTGSEEPASYAFTSTDAVGKAGGIATWEHVDTSSPIVESSGATGTGTTVTAGSVTTTAAHTPIIFVAGALGAATTTPPTGLTERWDIASNGKYKASAESASVVQPESGPSGSKSATLSTSGGGWEAQLIALRPE
jgi:hypothetical protein